MSNPSQYPNANYGLCNQHSMCRALASLPLESLRSHFLPAVVAPSPELGSDPVSRRLADDLVMVLSVRGGRNGVGIGNEGDSYVVAQHLAAAWPAAVDELWKQALINQRNLKLQVIPVATADKPPAIYTVACSHWTVGGQLFRLENVLQKALPNGALVTVTSAKAMFVWPIASKREIRNIPLLLKTVRSLGKVLGPQMSSSYYWLYQNELYDLHVTGDGTQIRFPIELRDPFLALPGE